MPTLIPAQLTVDHGTAGKLDRALRNCIEHYDVDYIWLRDEHGNPIGVVMTVEKFKVLRERAG